MGKKILTPPKGFTPAFLDNLKPRRARFELADKSCPGLRARVAPTSTVTFVWYYKDGDKTRVLTLGTYGKGDGRITLKQARTALEKAKAKRKDGISVGVSDEAPTTVKELAEVFYERRIKPHRKRPESVQEVLDRDIIPKLGKRKIATLTAPVLAHMVEQVVDRGAETYAGKVLQILKQMFRFAEGRGYIDRSPAYALDRKDLGVVDNIRDRYMDATELKTLWHAMEDVPRLSLQVKLGLRLLILTGVRTAELLNAKWEDIDLEKGRWFIPEENSKTVAWTVPLVPAAVEILEALRSVGVEVVDDETPVVWVMSTRAGHLSDKAMARALSRMFEIEDDDGVPLLDMPKVTPHDFRRTMRTHMDDLKIEPHIAEKCLNHSLGRIEKTYNKNDLFDQRREALDKYADWVDLVIHDRDNVVQIGGAA